MLPIMSSVLLLQPVAPAHVRERDGEKTNRHDYEHNVLHTLTLRENASADFPRV
jgi:hypothetical protein